MIIKRLVPDKENVGPELVLSRSTFLANYFSASRLLRSLMLDNGYSPSTVGNPARLGPDELVSVQNDQMASRVSNRLLRSLNRTTLPLSGIKERDKVTLYFNTTQMKKTTGVESRDWESWVFSLSRSRRCHERAKCLSGIQRY